MNEHPDSNEEQIRERVNDAWEGLASGFVEVARKSGTPVGRTYLSIGISVDGLIFKAQAFPTFVTADNQLPTELMMFLIRDNQIQFAGGAKLEWEATQPQVLSTFNFQNWNRVLSSEEMIRLVNFLGAAFEQPHNQY